MKRLLIFIAALGLLFASCSYESSDSSETDENEKTQKLELFSFVLDKDFISTVQQSSGIANSNSVTVRIEFTGNYTATDTKTLKFSELKGTSFTFTDIPLNKAFTITVSVYHGSVLKYEAKKEDVILEKGGKNDLSLLLKSVFEFADETKLVVWSDNQMYTMDNTSGKLTPLWQIDEMLNFFFDAPGDVWYYSMMTNELVSSK